MMSSSFFKQSLLSLRMDFGSVGPPLEAVDRGSHWHFD
jgi:hypothetical protein